MARIPTTGPLTMTTIKDEFALNATELGRNPNALGSYRGTRHDAGFFPSGTISYSNFQGRMRRFTISDTVISGFNVNLYWHLRGLGWDGLVPIEANVRVNPWVASADGGFALVTGWYPAGSNIRLQVDPGAVVIGRGGAGGRGGNARGCGADGQWGTNGGPAIYYEDTQIQIFNYGLIAGGGGGGGGGAGHGDWNAAGGGGGGGAGFGLGFPEENWACVTAFRFGRPGSNGGLVTGGPGGGRGNCGVGIGGAGGGPGAMGETGRNSANSSELDGAGQCFRGGEGIAGNGGMGGRDVVRNAARVASVNWGFYGDVRGMNQPPAFNVAQVDLGNPRNEGDFIDFSLSAVDPDGDYPLAIAPGGGFPSGELTFQRIGDSCRITGFLFGASRNIDFFINLSDSIGGFSFCRVFGRNADPPLPPGK